MPRKKQKKFAEIELSSCVIEPSKPNYKSIKGNWYEHFSNSNPIIVELACGYGEYTNGLAKLFQEKNFIGVDIKGDRIWRAAAETKANQLENTAFLRCQIDHLSDFFAPQEIDEIWIIHPDPFLRDGDKTKRLTSPKFLKIYRQICKPQTKIHLKTDNKNLFEYTLAILKSEGIIPNIVTENLHSSPYLHLHHGIITRFEQKALKQHGEIYYVEFTLNSYKTINPT